MKSDCLPAFLPSIDKLRETGSLKWSGIKTSSGEPTLGAWIAEMDFGTSPEVAATLHRAIDNGLLGYRPKWVEQELLEATAFFQKNRFGWEISPEDVRMVSAVLPALHATIQNLTRPGSAIVVPTPAYMPFLTIPLSHGREVIQVPSIHDPHAEQSWKLNLAGIEAALERGAGLVVLSNPWNPTGRIFTRGELQDFFNVLSRYDALVFADEIHSPIVLDPDKAFTSYASLGEEYARQCVTATAASKGWNIAGLPCAQVIIPDVALRERWDTLVSGITEGTNTFGAIGAITAYTKESGWQRSILDIIQENLRLLIRDLGGTGIDIAMPEGTYLAWCGFKGVSSTPATDLREKEKIAINAGETLGDGYAEWGRINLACTPESAQRIAQALCHLAATAA